MPDSTVNTPLTRTQQRYLKSMAHHLKPLVMLGNNGASAEVIKELATTLEHHELVKVKLAGDRDTRNQQRDQLLQAVEAQLVQQIGHTITLFKRNVEQPLIALPR